MNGFRWAAPEQLPQLCAPSLAAIHGQLLHEGRAVDAAARSTQRMRQSPCKYAPEHLKRLAEPGELRHSLSRLGG